MLFRDLRRGNERPGVPRLAEDLALGADAAHADAVVLIARDEHLPGRDGVADRAFLHALEHDQLRDPRVAHGHQMRRRIGRLIPLGKFPLVDLHMQHTAAAVDRDPAQRGQRLEHAVAHLGIFDRRSKGADTHALLLERRQDLRLGHALVALDRDAPDDRLHQKAQRDRQQQPDQQRRAAQQTPGIVRQSAQADRLDLAIASLGKALDLLIMPWRDAERAGHPVEHLRLPEASVGAAERI